MWRPMMGTRDYLLKEIVEKQILWRLPVNSIIRMSCVCKSWYSLIRSRNFISRHLHKTRIREAPPLVFLRNFANDRRKHGQLSFILKKHNHPFELDYLYCKLLRLPGPSLDFNVLGGSCNGVICLFGIQNMSTFILCNPSISRSLSVPMPQLVPFSKPTLQRPRQLSDQLLGFGFDEEEEDYKIVRIVASDSTTNWAAELYSLNSNYWWPVPPIHGVPAFDFVMNNTVGAFVNGRLHWIVVCRDNIHTYNTCNFILVFDLNHETFHHISFPGCLEGSDAEGLRVLAFQESSIVLLQPHPNRTVSRAWTLEEYGTEQESWKPTTIDRLDSRLVGSTITNDYDFMQVVHRFEASPLPYVPSLVLLDKQHS